MLLAIIFLYLKVKINHKNLRLNNRLQFHSFYLIGRTIIHIWIEYFFRIFSLLSFSKLIIAHGLRLPDWMRN